MATQLGKVQKVLGYCPQFDPLLELMTGTETVEMYARLKGVSAADTPGAAAGVLASVGLSRFAHRPCGEYSGGRAYQMLPATSYDARHVIYADWLGGSNGDLDIYLVNRPSPCGNTDVIRA